MSPASAEVKSTIEYLVATSRINRRFWAPGKEYNTGIYAPHEVTIRNARLAGPFTLDSHGFCIGHDPTDITDWERNYGPESRYAAQVCEVALSAHGVPRLHATRRQAAPLDRVSRDRLFYGELERNLAHRAAASSAALTHHPCTGGRTRGKQGIRQTTGRWRAFRCWPAAGFAARKRGRRKPRAARNALGSDRCRAS